VPAGAASACGAAFWRLRGGPASSCAPPAAAVSARAAASAATRWPPAGLQRRFQLQRRDAVEVSHGGTVDGATSARSASRARARFGVHDRARFMPRRVKHQMQPGTACSGIEYKKPRRPDAAASHQCGPFAVRAVEPARATRSTAWRCPSTQKASIAGLNCLVTCM
jgi:hypothetical protein